ncbi:toxin-antitoxin system YwqK family antitoxin [Chitinophaga sancti]|uniref:toxin-antitoxin system YwqK family antitoxin n=1 Tax=Chitinophaga sancti TaxID=1004 RepID=UPI003F7A433C
MTTALKCTGTLLLFIIAVHCNNPRPDNATLKQIMRDEDGTVYKRVFTLSMDPNRERVEIYFKSGILKELYFRKGDSLDGPRQLFYNSGMLSESGNWHNDRRVGEFRYYREDGQLDCVQYYGLLSDGSR